MRTTILSAVGLLGAAVLTGASATAVGETCRGEAATHVGTPQATITGTEGRDVVVTAGAYSVDTRGGDDLVCVTDGVETFVSTWAGADVVDASAAGPTSLSVVLGAGNDTFEGAAKTLTVLAGNVGGGGLEVDDGVDVVRVGLLPDARTRVESGQPGLPNGDVIRLAGGGDVRWDGPMAAGAELVGGVGANRLQASLPGGDVEVDLAAGTASGAGAGGAQDLHWSGFESYVFRGGYPDAVTELHVAGSREDDLVDVQVWPMTLDSPDPRITASLGRGDDVLNTSPVGAPGSSYDGGAGRDRLGVAAWGTVALDLATGILSATANGVTSRASVSSFQDAHVWGRTVRILGSRESNVLTASGCRGSRVSGGRGADRIQFTIDTPHTGGTCIRIPQARFGGGRGNDRIVGGPGDDRLIGGLGEDRVEGGLGRDACQGEQRSTCESKLRG